MTPTARSLEWCRAHNIDADVVEKWNPHARIRQDLFNFADLVALERGRTGVLAIQATTTVHSAARVKKILAEPKARAWLECGNSIEVWGWAKHKLKRGGTAVRWVLDRRPVTLADFGGEA